MLDWLCCRSKDTKNYDGTPFNDSFGSKDSYNSNEVVNATELDNSIIYQEV